MSITGWSLVRFLHVLAATGWVGGQLVLSGVVLPVLRKDLDPATRGPLVRRAARRFGNLANAVLLPTLVVTGLFLVAHRHVSWDDLTGDGYGRLLAIKLVFVVLAIVVAAGHGILALRRPSSARPLAVLSLLLSVAIVLFATALVP